MLNFWSVSDTYVQSIWCITPSLCERMRVNKEQHNSGSTKWLAHYYP